MFNKLISRGHRAAYHPDRYDENRCSGRSTALALDYIAMALQNSGTWYKVEDHHGTTLANDHLFALVRATVHKLDLKHFEFKAGGTFRVNMFTSNPWEVQ